MKIIMFAMLAVLIAALLGPAVATGAVSPPPWQYEHDQDGQPVLIDPRPHLEDGAGGGVEDGRERGAHAELEEPVPVPMCGRF